MTINRFGVMSPGEIIDKATMDKVKISRAASSLTGRGLIRQDVNPRDQRSKQLKVTRKGQGLVQKLVSTSRETEALVSSGVTAAEWATLGRLLAKVNAHMARQQAADDN
jgi:DNA-binding MarR family transcriptional regulator